VTRAENTALALLVAIHLATSTAGVIALAVTRW